LEITRALLRAHANLKFRCNKYVVTEAQSLSIWNEFRGGAALLKEVDDRLIVCGHAISYFIRSILHSLRSFDTFIQ